MTTEMAKRKYAKKNSSLRERLYLHTDKRTDGCWTWLGGKQPGGHGTMWTGDRMDGAHRISYIVHNGKIPIGLSVCHKCDVPACVNPAHLFLGTNQENRTDSKNKMRHTYGHKHPMAKLKPSEVIAIRRLYKTERYSLTELGKFFDVTPSTTYRVVNNQLWTHL